MIREFSRIHPDALPSLSIWYAVVRRAGWKNFAELKADFASADQVDRRTVFDIGGGKYRLVALVNYRGNKVFILFIMKHSEYIRNRWK